MLPSRILLNAGKKTANSHPVPVEMYPLFAAVAVACTSACYFTYRHFAHDKHLRLWKNADLSALDDVLNEEAKKNNK